MWWHKLIRDWNKTDYAFFSAFTWILVFSLQILIRLIQGRIPDLVFAALLAIIMIPVELLIVAAFQKYSSNIENISSYPALQPTDFKDGKLLIDDKILVFFYAEWCPFCRKSFPLLKSLNESESKVFRVDLSNLDNPLWDSLNIKIVPTLIAFKNGTEYWRKDGISMIGLTKKDFEQAVTATKTAP
jgi:thiol-disulfide isomerase/thioredoxin